MRCLNFRKCCVQNYVDNTLQHQQKTSRSHAFKWNKAQPMQHFFLLLTLLRNLAEPPHSDVTIQRRWLSMVWKSTKQWQQQRQPLQSICLKSTPFHLVCVYLWKKKVEQKITSTWTIASLYLLKAHISLPSKASFWHCHLLVYHIVPASGFHLQGRLVISIFHQVLIGLWARTQHTKIIRVYMYSNPSLCSE